MEPSKSQQFAALAEEVSAGHADADGRLLQAVYGELRAIAGSYFRNQNANHTLEPTALVHEAFLKLVGAESTSWEGRAHFIAVAAKAMRQILIDHARQKRTAKRGGDAARVTLTGIGLSDSRDEFDALDIDEALTRLATVDERQARVVEFRFFAGLGVKETALVLGVSERTVEVDWRLARAWLRRELRSEAS
ncbi:MAG: ECF-type sigma factor [Phycisphaerales bacterium]